MIELVCDCAIVYSPKVVSRIYMGSSGRYQAAPRSGNLKIALCIEPSNEKRCPCTHRKRAFKHGFLYGYPTIGMIELVCDCALVYNPKVVSRIYTGSSGRYQAAPRSGNLKIAPKVG